VNGNGGLQPTEASYSEVAPPNGEQRSDPKTKSARKRSKDPADPYADRKSISEVLHDIYDKNVQ
jgi:hypothetical protein